MRSQIPQILTASPRTHGVSKSVYCGVASRTHPTLFYLTDPTLFYFSVGGEGKKRKIYKREGNGFRGVEEREY